MDDPNLLEVTRKEIHYWPMCQCMVCENERARRAHVSTPVKRMSVEAAHVFGIIPRRSLHGSVARQLQIESEAE